MHAGSPCLSSVAKRTRSQWEIFYRNWHNEVKKEEASEAGVGDNEGSYSLNPENNEISKKRGVKRTGESVDGKNADSVGGGSRGKKKSGKKIDSVDDQIIGSCSKSGPISNVGCDAFKKCGFSDVDQTARGRGRPRAAPSNEGMHVSIDASVDLGKSVLFVDSEDSEKSMDLESSDTANSNSDDSGMLVSNSSSEEENDNSDKDISSAPGNSSVSDTANSNSDDSGMLESKSSSEEDSDKDFQVNISSISGDSDVSSFCSDDACCDGSPIEMKIDSEEKERTFVHQEDKCINVGNSKIINEERDGEMAGSKRNCEQYSDYGCMDNPQEVGDGTMKSSKEENEDLNKSGLKKRKFSGIQNLADRHEEHDKEQTSMTGCLRPCMISRPQKKNLNSHSENEESKSQTKDSCNTKCVQRTDQKGRRKVWTPRTKNLDSIKMLINSIEKEAQEPVKKHTSVDINAMNPKSLPFKFRFEDEEPSPPEKSEWEKEIDSLFCDLDMGLRESEFGCKNSSTSNDDDDIIPQDIDCTPAARCSRGEHDPVLDDQIGIKCRYCSAVILEIEDILPPFYTPPSGRQDRKYFYESHSSCGMKLRGDDPVEMKNFISSIESRVNEMKASPGDGQSIINSKRMDFMLDTIYDIKDNKKRPKESVVQHTQIKKWLQEWWLSGDIDSLTHNIEETACTIDREVSETQKMLQLAAAQRMNTDARKIVFLTLFFSQSKSFEVEADSMACNLVLNTVLDK
ncbi:Hypothetical predicted protein [Olea europaea subsp. europaea]|uniref:Uncharacterized protein n=1 Tax=Olea europaea subsp. europaea TaxID=158383 RepID=A0A8S0QBB5_OLEEU|nr:Hypothetical predicted protein [Olea europaea subsp. europaea]